MRSWIRALVLLLAITPAAAVVAGTGGTGGAAIFGTALEVTQAVNGVTSPTSQVSATTGPVAYSPSAGSLDQQGNTAVPVADTTAIPVLTSTTYGNGTLSQAQIIAQATTYIDGQEARLATDLSAYLASIHADRAYFTYDQEVMPVGAAHSMRLVWTFTVDSSGAATYAAPQILDTDPVMIYMVYTPSAVAAGLPAGWAYPNAGVLQYQLRNTAGTALSNWVSINTYGAFDEPQSGGAAVDPDAGVKCLVDATSGGCPQGYPDAKTLIATHGAMYAILDYVRMVQPEYTQQESPPGSGQYVQVPVMSMSVNSRVFDTDYCSLSYTNQGQYGYTLLNQTDRYYVPASGAYAQIGSYQGTSISPTQSYSYTRTDLTASQQALVSTLIIDPTSPMGGYLTAADVPNLVYLAPITENQCIPPPPPPPPCTYNASTDYVMISMPPAGYYTWNTEVQVMSGGTMVYRYGFGDYDNTAGWGVPQVDQALNPLGYYVGNAETSYGDYQSGYTTTLYQVCQ